MVNLISVNTMSWAAGKVGAESISAPVSFLVDMDDGADMESAPTVVISRNFTGKTAVIFRIL